MAALASLEEWEALRAYRAALGERRMDAMFAADPDRATRMSVEAAGLFLDYSRNLIDAKGLELLGALARARGVEEFRDAMLAGQPVNASEGRAALHTALRGGSHRGICIGGDSIDAEVEANLERMCTFAGAVRGGDWCGHSGERISDVVNIGIGGSDLGPKMCAEALDKAGRDGPRVHFVSNVDGSQIERVLDGLNPRKTLFVVASKTFTTLETMANARAARGWLIADAPDEAAIARHFVAVSASPDAARAFGLPPANVFAFSDWVGGRFSVWSAVGLSLLLAIGEQDFRAFLAGARDMDRHFAEAPVARNMPMILGLLGLWYRNFMGASSHCVVPYAQALHRFPAYLQQLEMESNGKSIGIDGRAVGVATCPVLWGEPGTNAQHAFFQLLHQGTDLIPVDFILPARPAGALDEQHRMLVANCLAQGRALMVGTNAATLRGVLKQLELSDGALEAAFSQRFCPGNRPSNTMLVPDVSARSLGALLSLYEHKVVVQAALWGLNPFDQWGVELGKAISADIAERGSGDTASMLDGSTASLLARIESEG